MKYFRLSIAETKRSHNNVNVIRCVSTVHKDSKWTLTYGLYHQHVEMIILFDEQGTCG